MTPPSSGSRSSTRTSRSRTTSTSSPTCSWAGSEPEPGSCSTSRAWSASRGDAQQPLRYDAPVGPPAVAGLSGGQRQAVAVAKSVMWESKLVILDEPTAALGVAQTRQVLDLVRRLAERGLGVVIVSHNLHDVFDCADRITVLRLGQRVALLERSKTTQQEVVHAITAGTLDHVPGMETAEAEA